MTSLRGGNADEAIQLNTEIYTLPPSPLCRRGRQAELGDVEASVFEHVAAQMIFLGRSCEFASRPIQPAVRGLPRRAGTAGRSFFGYFL
jgi:hypothetical protein